ncbi:TetR/AcrR family transcriptional regulator [Mucilaginibacter sp. X5P1]|uniref:TetR/AcrR family transcriptional regulator n=1 Tax=Mucilaginibacter sp. X5P1 TaxID=2723088 RepID=UPI001622AA23|nr:TetR/AcrR family transcriptional regulator [Mucilaginibacter sp. X5P1]MBB6141675.1 AcrR family transcriptional regulator [Mucilaginibacter sp. X5P1]
MATPRKKNKKWNGEETKRLILETVSTIMNESGYTNLQVMKITRRMGKSKGMIGYHYRNLNELLKLYIQQKDYWPPLFERFNFTEHPGEEKIKHLFTELMQDNLKLFQETTEMQKIILWQISQDSPMLRSVSEEREKGGEQLLGLAAPYFIHTGINFKAIIALLLGGSYYMVLHSRTNKSSVCGIDLNWDHDKEEVHKTIQQVITWAWEKAQEKRAS